MTKANWKEDWFYIAWIGGWAITGLIICVVMLHNRGISLLHMLWIAPLFLIFGWMIQG